MGFIRCGRHFALLAVMAALVLSGARWHAGATSGPLGSFAFYGALHAVAVVQSCRAAPSLTRRLAFVALAAGLSMLTVMVAVGAAHGLRSLPARALAPLLLGSCSAFGAVTYLVLIRACLRVSAPTRAAALVPLLCALATLLIYCTGLQSRVDPEPAFAIAWWFALSGGICGLEAGSRLRHAD